MYSDKVEAFPTSPFKEIISFMHNDNETIQGSSSLYYIKDSIIPWKETMTY